jgi:hypothetical protein
VIPCMSQQLHGTSMIKAWFAACFQIVRLLYTIGSSHPLYSGAYRFLYVPACFLSVVAYLRLLASFHCGFATCFLCFYIHSIFPIELLQM